MNTSSKTNLFEKYGNGTITDQERLKLHHWYMEYARSSNAQPDPEAYERQMEEMDRAIMARLNTVDRKFYASPYVKAAFLLIAMSITFYFWNS
jgi:transmembrane sensor